MDDLEGLPAKSSVRESNGHPSKVGADIKADREVRNGLKHLKYFLV